MNINSSKTCEEEAAWNDMDIDLADADWQRLLDAPPPPPQQQQQNATDLLGFDMEKGQTWIYPSNLPCRAYQQSISQAALYKNTLVVLPTGLGKTFIAAVVMYNIYRWYPQGKIIFLAPTRPLVAQQIEACKRIMPLPTQDTVELTGKLPKHKRFELWRTKRVFFATPQSVQSDIVGSGNDAINGFPFAQIKLLVIDEAHKAKGRFAYTEVTQAIWRNNRFFRVLALSATPGRSVNDVAEVIQNLFISHLEVRWDNSIDVMPYVHQRSMKTVIVPLGEAIQKVRTELIAIIDPYERQLIEAGVISGSCTNISRNFLLYEHKRFREQSLRESHAQQSTVNSNFSICISLYHALELLERHGLRVFVNYFEQDDEGRSKFIYNLDLKLRQLIDRLRVELGPNPFDTSINTMTNGQVAQMPLDLDFGHPKFEHARSCLMQHFEQHAESRAIVFCEYRESVLLMYRLLLQHVPLLRPRCFAGHSGTGALRALTQKQQIQIMKDFREGKSNVLVATSIGEEGIDVGEVELIICFDISTANPTRFVQRIGRTGRRKKGNVVMLITEGKEQRMLKDVMANKDQTNKKILRSPMIQAALYKQAPRMVPAELNPMCVQQVVEFAEEVTEQAKELPQQNVKEKKVKKSKYQNVMEKGSQDLRKFFNKNNNNNNNNNKAISNNQRKQNSVIDLDKDDMEVFEVPVAGAETQAAMESSFKERFSALDLSDLRTKTNTQQLNLLATQTREVKHLRKVNKLLGSVVPLVPESKRNLPPSNLLKSKQLSNASKLLLLQQQYVPFVLDVCEKINVLEALEENNAMCKEEQELRQQFNEITNIFGGESSLSEFVNRKKTESINTMQQFENSEEDMLCNEQDLQDSMQSIFAELDCQLFTRDNYAIIRDKFQQTESYMAREGDIDESSMREEVDLPAIYEVEDMTEVTTDYETRYETHENVEAEALEFSKSLSPIPNEIADLSAVNCSIEDTTKLMNAWKAFSNCAKSTPLITKSPRKRTFAKSSDLLKQLNECAQQNTTPENLPDVYFSAATNNKPAIKISPPTTNVETALDVETQLDITPANVDVKTELELDLDMFLEPFPEEDFYTAKVNLAPAIVNSDSQKENERNSPDLFEISEKSSTKKPTLAAKLAQKCLNKPLLPANKERTPTKKLPPNNVKSPSVFESYWQKVQMYKAKKMNSLLNKNKTVSKKETTPNKLATACKNEIICNSLDSDFEEIAASQEHVKPSILHARKRRRLCEYLDREAELSGSARSSDEADTTIGCYMLDSVVVHDDEVVEDAAHSRMQAMYLQSVKSPQRRFGGFKIPQYATFNDEADIFSQTMDHVGPSQYLPDSFVVEGDNTALEENTEICPLERAEMILKERRKARKLQNSPSRKRKRKVFVISDSSDEN